MVYKESEYTVDEVLFVFYEYFKAYEDFLGSAHPPIRVGQIKNIIDAMPDFDPLTYPELIAQHFLTEYKDCDYNINHFFSGQIRELRQCEILY